MVCTHNESEHLPRLLESFRDQTARPSQFRVILVDNASTDDTARVIPPLARELGVSLTYVFEPELSYSAAMNAGFRRAETEYVAHTDAHCIVDPHWIERIAALTSELEPEVCGGPYFPFALTDSPAWFRYNRMDKGPERRLLGNDEFLSGANLVWKRSVVAELGGFDTVGLVGRGVLRGDETQLLTRLRRQKPNSRVVYEPSLIVHHLTRPETTSLGYWVNRAFQQGRNHELVHGPARRRPLRDAAELVARAALLAGAGAGSFLIRDRARYPRWQNYWFERLLPQIYRIGVIVSGVRPPVAARPR